MRKTPLSFCLGFSLVFAFAACSTEVIRVDEAAEPTPEIEPTDPELEAPADEDPDAPEPDASKPSKKDSGTTTPPKKDAGVATTSDASTSDASTNDASTNDASSGTDSGVLACGIENASCSAGSCCNGLRCSGNGKCVCESIACSSSSVTCCAGSPYCVAPSGFSLQCSASPGFAGYRCRASSDCANGYTCQAGTCKQPCTPSCVGRTCGSDGCGGSCGSCALGQYCSAGSCITPPQDECNPVSNTGCTAPNECILLANETPTCALLGSGTQGTACSASTPCDGGYSCFGGTCRKVCKLGSNAACPGTTTCNAVSGWFAHGACG